MTYDQTQLWTLLTLNSDSRYEGLNSIEVVVTYGLLNTLGGLSITPSCKHTHHHASVINPVTDRQGGKVIHQTYGGNRDDHFASIKFVLTLK